LAIFNTKPSGKEFIVEIKDAKSPNISPLIVTFNDDGRIFRITRENKVICVFISSSGPVGCSNASFRVSSGERRNFILGILTLVFIVQEEVHSGTGNHAKDFGIEFPKNFDPVMLQVSESEKKINELKTTSTPSITEKPVKEESKQKVSEHHPKKKVPRRAATISGGDTSERSSGRKTKGHDRKSGKDYSKTDKKHTEERLKVTTVHGKKNTLEHKKTPQKIPRNLPQRSTKTE